MLFDVALIGGNMAAAAIKSLKADGGRLKVLATAEAQKLATSLATIGQLLKEGQIDAEEAGVLVEIQKNASETVLASLEGVSKVSARRATHAALASVVGTVDGAIGVPLVGTLLKG